MSGHQACICGRKRGDHTDLVVTHRKHNHSYFEKGERGTWHRSRYSAVRCTRKGCWGMWRTCAPYVDELPDDDRDIVRGDR